MANGILGVLTLGLALASGVSAAQEAVRGQACVTLLDAVDQRAVSGARVTLANRSPAVDRVSTTSATGRACISGADSAGLQVDAVGYLPINLVIGTTAAPRILIRQMPEGTMQAEWGGRQIVAALTQILARPEIARDSALQAVLAELLRRTLAAEPKITVTSDSLGVLVLEYVDLTSDGSSYAEVRMRYHQPQAITFGVTMMRCGADCRREHDVAVAWRTRDGSGWTLDFLAVKDSTGAVARVDAGATATVAPADTASAVPESRPALRTTTIRGVIQSDKGRPLAGIDVYTADGAVFTVTDANGEYALAVPMPPGGALIATRRLGWAPQFRKVSEKEIAPVQWNPRLKSVTVLATQFVRAAGIHEALQASRYDAFLARRARGVGQFFMAEEIWSSVSLGDVLNHARGITARFSFGSNINSISVPSCPKSPLSSAIGVFVDGINQTSMASRGAPEANLRGANEAESVLARYVNSAIVGMEIYIGRTQLPPEFADPRYCAVISLWTR